jgi:CRISPR/Cas system CSM-associated protein Csm3 (group 7 of RAMP superfamily)
MMQHNIQIAIDLHFMSKWHAGSGESSLSIDRLVQRDARGWPFIPGSTLKGIVRENCEKLSRTLNFSEPADPHQVDLTIQDRFQPLDKLESPVDRIFGNKYQSGNLFFRDARLDMPPPHYFVRNQSQISVYRVLGTAREHHLFSSEYVAPMTLSTLIEGYHRKMICFKGDTPYEYCLLIAGIMSLEYLGGYKSTGSGKVHIQTNSIKYNGISLDKESVFEYLDEELYRLTKEEIA